MRSVPGRDELRISVLIVSAEKTNALSEPREEESLTKKGKKKKTVHWPEEEQLKNYFYFDLDETERGKAGRPHGLCCSLLSGPLRT